ncbi:MAG: hypothetical protein K6F90_06830 [Lachnospiraceae bacterium]|nr:hypothetical protein [Lachnospiraceae bacterium]
MRINDFCKNGEIPQDFSKIYHAAGFKADKARSRGPFSMYLLSEKGFSYYQLEQLENGTLEITQEEKEKLFSDFTQELKNHPVKTEKGKDHPDAAENCTVYGKWFKNGMDKIKNETAPSKDSIKTPNDAYEYLDKFVAIESFSKDIVQEYESMWKNPVTSGPLMDAMGEEQMGSFANMELISNCISNLKGFSKLGDKNKVMFYPMLMEFINIVEGKKFSEIDTVKLNALNYDLFLQSTNLENLAKDDSPEKHDPNYTAFLNTGNADFDINKIDYKSMTSGKRVTLEEGIKENADLAAMTGESIYNNTGKDFTERVKNDQVNKLIEDLPDDMSYRIDAPEEEKAAVHKLYINTADNLYDYYTNAANHQMGAKNTDLIRIDGKSLTSIVDEKYKELNLSPEQKKTAMEYEFAAALTDKNKKMEYVPYKFDLKNRKIEESAPVKITRYEPSLLRTYVNSQEESVTKEYAKLLNRKREADKLPQYDSVANPKEYIERNITVRRVNRSVGHARDIMQQQKLSLAQVSEAYKAVAGENELNKVVGRLDENSPNFTVRIWNYVVSNRPELLSGIELTKEEIGKAKKLKNPVDIIDQNAALQKKFIDKWKKDGLITGADIDLIKANVVLNSTRNFAFNDEVRFVSELEKQMSDEQKRASRQQLQSYTDVADLTENEKSEYPNRERVNELKNNMPAEISSDPEKKGLYEHYLDLASDKVTRLREDIRAERLSEENDHQHVDGQKSVQYEKRISEYKGGIYDQLFRESDTIRDIKILNEGKEDDLKDLYANGIRFSEKTKEGMHLIFNKMREMGLDNEKYYHAKGGEDGLKVYSFNKLLFDKDELNKALENGNPDEIIEKGKQYEKTLKDYDELYSLARKYLSDDEIFFPGNLDSVRNKDIPYEYTSDLATTARINAMFISYMDVAKNGMDQEEYIENPIKVSVENATKKIEEKGFTNLSKELGFEEAIELMTSSGKYKNVKKDFSGAVPTYGLGREFDSFAHLEGDKDLKDENALYGKIMVDEINRMMSNEEAKFNHLILEPRGQIQKRARIQTLQNLIVASGKPFNANTIFSGIPEIDTLGRKTGDGFDANRYMQENGVDYEGLIHRSNILHNKISKLKISTKADDVLEATGQLYLNVLTAHPEDKDNPYYKLMQEEYMGLYDRLSENAPEEQRERMKAMRDGYAEANPVVEKPKIWENPGFAYASVFKRLPALYFTMLKDEKKESKYTERTRSLNESITIANDDDIKDYHNYDPESKKIYNIKKTLEYQAKYSEENREKAQKFLNDLRNEHQALYKKEKEPYTKRMYADIINLMSQGVENYSAVIGENPDLEALISLNAGTISLDGKKFPVEEAKENMGSVFNDSLDMVHYGMEEFMIESERINTVKRLKNEGKEWGPEEEKIYTDRLKDNHAAFLRAFDSLDRYHGDTEKINKYRENPLEHDLGRGKENQRDIRRQAGKLRGELQALNMGWNSGDMAVLGYIGRIGASIEKNQMDNIKEGADELKNAARDFRELKDKFWNKRIETNADKKEASDALMSFIEKHKECKAVKQGIDFRDDLDKAILNVSREAIKTKSADRDFRELKEKDPVGYLRKLEQDGDIKKLARGISEIYGNLRMLRYENDKELTEKIDDYIEEVIEYKNGEPVKGREFMKDLYREIVLCTAEQGQMIGEIANELAKDIRNGNSPYSDMLGDIGKDYAGSNYIADAIVSKTEKTAAYGGAIDIIRMINMRDDVYYEDAQKIIEDYLSTKADQYTREQKLELIERNRHIEGLTKKKYGVEVGFDGDIRIPDEKDFKDKTKNRIERSFKDISGYKDQFEAIVQTAKEKLSELETLKAYKKKNTTEFTNMYKALKNVAELTGSTNPADIEKSLEDLGKASDAYVKAKLVDSRFAGRHGNGALRVSFANGMSDFAKKQTDALKSKKTGSIDRYDSVDRQIASGAALKEKTVREKVNINDIYKEEGLGKENHEVDKTKKVEKTHEEKNKGKAISS